MQQDENNRCKHAKACNILLYSFRALVDQLQLVLIDKTQSKYYQNKNYKQVYERFIAEIKLWSYHCLNYSLPIYIVFQLNGSVQNEG